MINVRGLQRNVKNVVKNYTEAQVKVREATSNDPWGPPSTLMAEIADLTHNVVAFSEIMQMIWKRLNDHGKNWRHVYKALSLLDYLIKTGSEKVAQQCKDNIYAIKTLNCFQHMEENKDQGVNVREKSKALVALLTDDEKLRVERERALKAKERFAQSVSYMSSSGSGENVVASTSDGGAAFKATNRSDTASSSSNPANPDLEKARPQTLGEEELHLRLALAMSKEEAEVEERQRKNDDLRLQLALTESEKEKQTKKGSALDDLLSIEMAQPASLSEPKVNGQLDVWGAPIASSSSNLNGLELLGAVGPSTSGATDDFFSAIDSQGNQVSSSQFDSESDSIWPALSTVNEFKVSQEALIANNDPWQPVSSTSATPEPNNKTAANDPWCYAPSSMYFEQVTYSLLKQIV
jgi:epsin